MFKPLSCLSYQTKRNIKLGIYMSHDDSGYSKLNIHNFIVFEKTGGSLPG